MAKAFALAGGVVAFLNISTKIGKWFQEIRMSANDLPSDLEGYKTRIECLARAARRLERIQQAEINNIPVEGPLRELFANARYTVNTSHSGVPYLPIFYAAKLADGWDRDIYNHLRADLMFHREENQEERWEIASELASARREAM